MKKDVIKKIISIFFIISILMNYACTSTKALSILENVFKDGEDFINTESDQNLLSSEKQTGIIGLSKDIYRMMITFGVIVASIVILVLGIQFMTGSIEQKAKVKEMLIPFLIGCVVVFGSMTIWRILVDTISSVA